MLTFRSIPTQIWRKDEWFMQLEPDAKLLWLWMQTNPNSCDAWQAVIHKFIEYETGIPPERISILLPEFEKVERIELDADKRYFRIFTSDLRCAKCGAGFDITLDHIIPRSWGGSDSPENQQWLCRSCNSSKGNRHATRY